MKTTSSGFDVLAQKIDDGQPIYKATFSVSLLPIQFNNLINLYRKQLATLTIYLSK